METSTVKDTAFVEHCLRMALWRREHTGRPAPAGLIHHLDAGSQYTSIRYADTLALEGLEPSIGSVGDAYDNAAAETVMGLFKNEAVAKDSPFRAGALKTETDVMEVVFEWVHWYNNERLHSALDHQTPEEYEQTYYDLQTGALPDDAANQTGGMIPGTVQPAGHCPALECQGSEETQGCQQTPTGSQLPAASAPCQVVSTDQQSAPPTRCCGNNHR